MSTEKDLLRTEDDGSLSFGNYKLAHKTKVSDFEFRGDLYKVKTFQEITKLERNETFVYESVPGTRVYNLKEENEVITFTVEGTQDAQITLGVEEDREYKVILDGVNAGHIKTGLGGKLSFSVELGNRPVEVKITAIG